MKTIQAAIYARVSSEQQAAAHTMESQLAERAERVQSDGPPVPAKRQSVDDGYKRATLVRPALERLRDLATRRVVNRVKAAEADEILDAEVAAVKFADCERDAMNAAWRDHGCDAATVRQSGVE